MRTKLAALLLATAALARPSLADDVVSIESLAHDYDAVEIRRLQNDACGVFLDFRIQTTHDSCDTDDGLVVIDQQCLFLQRSLVFIQACDGRRAMARIRN